MGALAILLAEFGSSEEEEGEGEGRESRRGWWARRFLKVMRERGGEEEEEGWLVFISYPWGWRRMGLRGGANIFLTKEALSSPSFNHKENNRVLVAPGRRKGGGAGGGGEEAVSRMRKERRRWGIAEGWVVAR